MNKGILEHEKILNENIIYYYDNLMKFKFINNNIYYNYNIFFNGDFKNNKLVNGKIYNILNNNLKHIIIYDGNFENGLPNGEGKILDNKMLFLNGLIFKITNYKINDLYLYYKININDNDFYNYYKNFIKLDKYRDDNNICKLHFSKKFKNGLEFINDNYDINFELIKNEYNITKLKKNKNLYYFNNYWQTPVVTEKQVFDIYFNNNNIPSNYFAFPWATLVDQINKNKNSNLLNMVYNYKITDSECFTVCQHISFRNLLPLMKKIGITHIFASHCAYIDEIFEKKYKIKIIPYQLLSYNYSKDVNTSNCDNNLLYWFKGSYGHNYYMNDVRKRLFELKLNDDIYIEKVNGWHFEKAVYDEQIKNKLMNSDNTDKNSEIIYCNFMKNYKFALCPNGSGPNTIRLWEALSFGCIPVILSNDHHLPDFIDWDDVCIIYNDSGDMNNLYDYLKNISLTKLKYKQNKCIEIFNNYFAPNKMNMIIDIYFEKNNLNFMYENLKVIYIDDWFNRLGNNTYQLINSIYYGLYYNYDIIIYPKSNNFKNNYILLNKKYENIIKNNIQLIDTNKFKNIYINDKLTKEKLKFNFFNKDNINDNLTKSDINKIFDCNHSNVINILKNIHVYYNNFIDLNLNDDDIVIYIRSGDLFNNTHPSFGYIQPPLSYYTNILDNNTYNKLYLVCEDKLNPVANKLIEKYNTIYKNQSLAEDINIILNAKILIESFSSLTCSLTIMSDKLKVIYRPHYQNRFYDKILLSKNIVIFKTNLANYWHLQSPWIEYNDEKKKLMLNYVLENDFEPAYKNFDNIYISLTSIKSRQKSLIPVLKSCINQSTTPNKITLNLSEEPYLIDEGFKNKILDDDLNEFIKKNNNLIEINWVKNIGPYRKLLPTLKNKWNENCLIITIDDDNLLKNNLILKHVNLYSIHNCQIGFRGNTYSKLLPFDYLNKSELIKKHKYNFLTGLGTILYKPSFFYKSENKIFNYDFIINNIPTTDDLFFYLLKIENNIETFIENSKSDDLLCPEKSLFKVYNSKNNIEMNNINFYKIYRYIFDNSYSLFFSDILKIKNIKQINISDGIDKNIKLPKLSNEYNINAPILFFGMYNLKDFQKFNNHKGEKYIVWCNKDCNYNNKNRKKLINQIKNDITGNYYYYDDCKKNLDLFGVSSEKVIL